MFRLAYRNFGDHESVVGNYTVSSGGVAGVRWFELRNVTSGPVTVYQQSTYQPDTTWRWMGSAAMDGQGNLAIGFSASSSSIKPQLRYAGRLATDPLNTLAQGEAHLFDGAGSQTGSGNRWGDYSALSIDPVDDATFWYTNEYYSSTTSFNWRTRIGSFKLATGNPTPTANTDRDCRQQQQLRHRLRRQPPHADCYTDSNGNGNTYRYRDCHCNRNSDAYSNSDSIDRQWWTRRQHIALGHVGFRRLLHQQRQLSSRRDGLHVFRREQQCVGTDLPNSHDSIDGHGKSDFLVQLQFE